MKISMKKETKKYKRPYNYIVMLGTSLETKGGISSVVNVYRNAGLFDRWPIIYLSTHCTGSPIRKIKTVIFALLRYVVLLITGRVSIVHVHSASGASFWRKSLFVVLALLARRRVIFHLHGGGFIYFYDGLRFSISKRFIRLVLEKSTIVIVMSESWKQLLSGLLSNPRIFVAHNPAPMVNTQNESMRNVDNNYILFLSRIHKAKGIFDLLEAVVLIRKRIPNVRLKCAGDSGLVDVARRVAELGIDDSVDMLGWVQGTEKQELLMNAAVYVLPSYMEGLPMGILEAMSARLPVVSTTVGGIPDIIEDGVEGYLINPGDVPSLADRIERLLMDTMLRKRMGEAGRRKVKEQYAPEKVLPLIEKLYSELLDAQEHSPNSA